jgi:glycosyltransferase involved in cell wall biosynthesis
VVEISVVIPTMNEETSIGAVLDEVRAALVGRDIEILTVDTDSRDRTNEIAAAKGARVVTEPRHGYGRAYKTGFAEARGTYVLTLDADLTYPAAAFRELLPPLETGTADFVAADRISRLAGTAMTGMHRIGNTMLNVAFRLLYRFPMRDSQSGMWAFRRELLPRLHVLHDGMAFSEELKVEVIRHGFRYLEVPIDYRTRLGEKKIRSFTDAFGNFFWLFRKRVGWIREPAESLG